MAEVTKINFKGTVLDIRDANAARASDLAAKQDVLVSGTNIKTINGESIVGTGDIEAGEVKSVTINGTKKTPDAQTGDVDLGNVSGTQGPAGADGADGKSAYQSYLDTTSDNPKKTEAQWVSSLKGEDGSTGATGSKGDDGITPHIDAFTGNWFIGDTDTQVKAQGPKGDSGVASGDGVVVVNDTSGEPAEITEGQVAVLGAGVGKYIADRAIPASGAFADAYDKAKANSSVVFPWMLIDEDESGEPVKKMIWHVGNRKFIDAIGAEIVGKKNGLTIISDEARTITLSFTDGSVTLPIDVGETNYSFNEIKELANVSGYNGDWFSGISFSGDTQPQLDIDFGGMTLKWTSSTRNFFPAYSDGSVDTLSDYLFKYIKRLRLDVSGYLDMYSMMSLKEVEMYGTWSYNDFGMLNSKTRKTFITEKADLKGLIVTNAVTSITLLQSNQNNYSLQYLDIRNFDTSNVTKLAMVWKCYDLKTLIIGGGFSNEKVTSLGSAPSYVAGNTTIVCTSQTPPVLKNAVLRDGTYVHSDMDWVYYRVKSNGRILVPPGCSDVYKNNVYIEPVDGEDVTITTDGKTTKTGWAMYADIIEEYNEGDY